MTEWKEPDAAEGDAPLCPICERPCQWMPRAGRWSGYCTHLGCRAETRICKNCRSSFARSNGGTRYCSVDCRQAWHREQSRQVHATGVCSHCGDERHGYNRWNLCQSCWTTITPVANRLKNHRTPERMVIELLRDPHCWNEGCRADLIVPRRRWDGNIQPGLVVDHDHTCCSGPYGCERCVRGFLCMKCNTAVGMMEDDADKARGLAKYIERHQGQFSDSGE